MWLVRCEDCGEEFVICHQPAFANKWGSRVTGIDSGRKDLTDITTILAIYASILSSINALMNFLHNRRNIKMSSRKHEEYFDKDGIVGVSDTWIVVTVVNKSRRPITITEVGARLLFPKTGFMNLTCNPAGSRELTEGQYLEAVADEEEIDLAEIEAWEAHDAFGNTYRLPVAPRLPRIRSRMRRRWTEIKRRKLKRSL